MHKKNSPRIYPSMHSGGFELTKLTYYTRLEDNNLTHTPRRQPVIYYFVVWYQRKSNDFCVGVWYTWNITKVKVHPSCEIEDFSSSKLILASCVWYPDRAYYWVCVLMKGIGRRLPLQLQRSLYHGQQGDVSQSVRGNYKTRFRSGQNLTAAEGNSSVY